MSTIDDTVERIKALAQEIGIAELARRAGVADSTLRELSQPGWNPRRSTLAALAKVLPPAAGGPADAERADPHSGLPPQAGEGVSDQTGSAKDAA